MDLQATNFRYFDEAVTETVTGEDIQEAIIPDNFPDGDQIIYTAAENFIRGKDNQNGRATVHGSSRLYVTYRPQEEENPRKIAIDIPFSAKLENPQIKQTSTIVASCDVKNVRAALSNPRKISGGVTLDVHFRVFNETENEVPNSLSDNDGNVVLKTKSLITSLPSDIREKTFSVVDEQSLSLGAPDITEVISTKSQVTEIESKLVGSKLILKGVLVSEIAYISTDGAIENAAFSSEFSQIADGAGIHESASLELLPIVTGSYLELLDDGAGEVRRISIETHLAVQIIAVVAREITYIADAYALADSDIAVTTCALNLPSSGEPDNASKVTIISAIDSKGPAEKKGKKPAVVITSLSGEDTIWDIAKKYRVPQSNIELLDEVKKAIIRT
ncbi:MAG: hypothetical protein LBQ91_03250 [Oscillospiraceae bacterium]|jgi:hypothetical protein|nr:hypothetical protein [Oscillospiraceae bacterium]